MTTILLCKLDSGEVDDQEDPFVPKEGYTPPLFGKPREIGYFSVNAKRDVVFDKSQMKYLIFPPKNCDLSLDLNFNLGTDLVHNYVTLDKMHQTLKWLLHNKKQSMNSTNFCAKKSNVDFITVRGALVLISCTPYLKGHYRCQWEICATKFQGIIYFAAVDTDVDIEENKNIPPYLAKCQSWGYKFEQYMTTDTIGGKSDLESNTFQMEEFCIVLQNKISKYSILYKAEVDAVIPHRFPGPGSGDTTCYTELKTSKIIQGDGHSYMFHRNKLLNWWAQSFMAGIPEIICGFRTADGIVKHLETFRVSNIPQKAIGLWSSDACLSFCERFLNFIQKIVTEDDPRIIYKFHYKGENQIYCSKLKNPSSRYNLIPDWYINGMMEK